MTNVGHTFAKWSTAVAKFTGRPLTFAACLGAVIVWALTGPIFGYSDTWQLIINTSTTIITFLMVFLIQNTQNRDSSALQAKLDELIRASHAKNRFIGIEHLSDEELDAILEECERNRPQLVDKAQARVAREKKAPAKAKPSSASRRSPPKRAPHGGAS